MKKKILYVTTISNTMSFFVEHIRMLIDNGCTVELACNVVKDVEKELIEMGCKVHNVPFSRSVLSASNIKSLKIIGKIIEQGDYDIIHTHTPNASAITRIAAKIYKNNAKIIYTAHGFHFYKGAPLKNWLLFYPVEKFLARWTDVLITINTEDYERAKKKFKAKVVEYVPGVGFDAKKINKEKDIKELRDKFNIPQDAIVLLTVGELNKNKNQKIVIEAISKINNDKIHYLLCGVGKFKGELEHLAKQLEIDNRTHFLGYRNDLSDIYGLTDVYLCPSIREGLNVSIMEAMANGLPCIVSEIRGNIDLIINHKGGCTVNSMDILKWVDCIEKVVREQNYEEMKKYNLEYVKKFNINNVKNVMKKIYMCCFN